MLTSLNLFAPEPETQPAQTIQVPSSEMCQTRRQYLILTAIEQMSENDIQEIVEKLYEIADNFEDIDFRVNAQNATKNGDVKKLTA